MTAKLHQVEKKVESAQRERPEARQWHCVGEGHWRSQCRGARALRSPSAARIAWSEKESRVTIELSSRQIIDEVYPRLDGCVETAARGRLGGSRAIQTKQRVGVRWRQWKAGQQSLRIQMDGHASSPAWVVRERDHSLQRQNGATDGM